MRAQGRSSGHPDPEPGRSTAKPTSIKESVFSKIISGSEIGFPTFACEPPKYQNAFPDVSEFVNALKARSLFSFILRNKADGGALLKSKDTTASIAPFLAQED